MSLAPKLKYEHVYLTSFSKMRVDLAAQVHIVTYMNDHNDILHEQVLSSSVAKALTLRFGSSSAATAQFIQLMDSFFDCLNVGNYTNGRNHRKHFQHPYTSHNDFRFKVCTNEFQFCM